MKKQFIFIFYFFSIVHCFAQLDAKKLAADYHHGIVKILLFDSLSEKNDPGTGYIGRGSGFIVSEDGIIFTNRHVVEMCVNGYISYEYNDFSGQIFRNTEAYSRDIVNDSSVTKVICTGYTTPIVQIYFGEGENDYKLYVARVLEMSVGGYDGAMLEIVSDLKGVKPSEKFSTLPIGNSDLSVQGEDLCVYGYPAQIGGGFETMLQDMSTLTFGKMSGYDYVLNKDYGFIKTDASINSGNSGGPVFNESGKVIGIATATGNMTNIGLAGAVNGMYYVARSEKEILDRLAANGLTKPKQSNPIATVTGEREPILTAEEINKKIELNSKLLNYYKNAKIIFYYYKNGNDPDPQPAVKFLVPPSGGFVTVDVSNAPGVLNTDQLTAEIWKREGNDYSVFVVSQNVAVKSNLRSFRFKQIFSGPGDYKINIYAHDKRLISSAFLSLSKVIGNPRLSPDAYSMKVDYGIFNSFVCLEIGRGIPTGSFAKQPRAFVLSPFSFADPFRNDDGIGAQKGMDYNVGFIYYLHRLTSGEKMQAGLETSMHVSANKINWDQRGGIWLDSVKYTSFVFMSFQGGAVLSFKLVNKIAADLNFDLCPVFPIGLGEVKYDNGKSGAAYNYFNAGGVGGSGIMNEAGINIRYKFLFAHIGYWFGKINCNYDFVYGSGPWVGGKTYDSSDFKSKINVSVLRLSIGLKMGR